VTQVSGGGKDGPDPAPAALEAVQGLTVSSLRALREETEEWWKSFWLQSFIDIDDPILEGFYYGAQYQLGASSREGKAAPGLYGPWVTRDDSYYGNDLHLNYNAIASYYGTYSSNRPELALPLIDALWGYLPEAKRRSEQDLVNLNPTWIRAHGLADGIEGGALFPVGISAFSTTTNPEYYQQTLNGLFSATPFLDYYDATGDETFLRDRVVPFIRPLAVFFASYLQWDPAAGEYVLWAGHNEGGWSKNSSPDLGVLKRVLRALIDANVTLEISDPRQQEWKDILANLPDQPTKVLDGKRVYTLAEPGTTTNGPGSADDMNIGAQTVNLEFVQPGDQLGILGPSADRQAAIDTLDAMNPWANNNTFPKSFTQAARVGYPGDQLVGLLKARISAQFAPNLRVDDGHHGLEKSGAIEALNNMLLQSDDGAIVLFPVWPAAADASFTRLRTPGSFVVSGRRTAGVVSDVWITSEAGGVASLVNPWPGERVRVIDASGRVISQAAPGRSASERSTAVTASEQLITWETSPGMTYAVVPAGPAPDVPCRPAERRTGHEKGAGPWSTRPEGGAPEPAGGHP
jgi:hypothetical protein